MKIPQCGLHNECQKVRSYIRSSAKFEKLNTLSALLSKKAIEVHLQRNSHSTLQFRITIFVFIDIFIFLNVYFPQNWRTAAPFPKKKVNVTTAKFIWGYNFFLRLSKILASQRWIVIFLKPFQYFRRLFQFTNFYTRIVLRNRCVFFRCTILRCMFIAVIICNFDHIRINKWYRWT